MIYSYITPNSITESTKKSEEIVSVVYNEYCNYKNLLESCTDEHERPILEAKVEVLYEVSISDIIEKIKEIIKKVFAAIAKFIQKTKERIVKFFSNNKENLKTAKEVKQYLKGFNIKTSKVKNESLEDKLSGMCSTIASNPDMYFDFNDVVGNPDNIVKTIDNVILFAMNYIDGNFDNEKMKQMMDDYKFKFTADNSILSAQFITKYMKSAGNDAHQAIIQYINSKFNSNFLSDSDKIIDAMIDTFQNSEDQMAELKNLQEKLKFKESKLESLVEKLKNGRQPDDDRFARSYEWIREILKLLSKNVAICTEISNCLARKQAFCNQNIKTFKAFLKSSKVTVTQ